MKVIRSLENRKILLKGTTTKISVLIPIGLSAEMSGADAAIPKKMFESGTTVLINSNEEMEDIMKIVKSLEESR